MSSLHRIITMSRTPWHKLAICFHGWLRAAVVMSEGRGNPEGESPIGVRHFALSCICRRPSFDPSSLPLSLPPSCHIGITKRRLNGRGGSDQLRGGRYGGREGEQDINRAPGLRTWPTAAAMQWRGETGDSLGIRSIHGHHAISSTVPFSLVRWWQGRER